jgi:hypothetical protein
LCGVVIDDDDDDDDDGCGVGAKDEQCKFCKV